MDVHVNRTPVGGAVTHVEYHPGSFLPAYKVEAGELNEWTEVWFETNGRPGRLPADRRHPGAPHRLPSEGGDTVERGQRYGVMKFGSRIDLLRAARCDHPGEAR